jgi:hypothetical protein
MNCFIHNGRSAVGVCALCGKAVCRECLAQDTPRLVCASCAARGVMPRYGWYGWYGYGYEYKSSMSIGAWPLIHVCAGVDPATLRPKVAKGVIAIGNIAVGALAIGGLAFGLFTVGGASIGLLMAIGGAALGPGVSVGGFAVGSIAIGGAAVGFVYAIGGGAFGPAVMDGRRCDPAALDFARRWLAGLRTACR